jgi:hypothetical protein
MELLPVGLSLLLGRKEKTISLTMHSLYFIEYVKQWIEESSLQYPYKSGVINMYPTSLM